MALIPPQPVGVAPGHGFWNDWIERLRSLVNDMSQGQINHNDLQNIQGGNSTERYHLNSTQHTDLTDAGDSTLHFHATDRARNNHTGTQLMATISDLPVLVSGTYTPTLTNEANLDASTVYSAQYLRVGNVVTVSGQVDVDPTAATTTQLGISLPIASNFANINECAGTANAATNEAAAIFANTVDDRARVQWVAGSTANHTLLYTFTYRII